MYGCTLRIRYFYVNQDCILGLAAAASDWGRANILSARDRPEDVRVI